MSLRKSTAVWLAVAIAAVCWTPVFAQTYKADGNKVKAHIEYLASDQLEGRQTLTPGYQKAADYVAAKFKEWGLKPSGDNGTSYFQKVPIARPVTVNVGVPALSVDGRPSLSTTPTSPSTPCPRPRPPSRAPSSSSATGCRSRPRAWTSTPGIDVKGKIVLAYKGSPETYIPPAGRGMMAGRRRLPGADRPGHRRDHRHRQDQDGLRQGRRGHPALRPQPGPDRAVHDHGRPHGRRQRPGRLRPAISWPST